MVRINLGDRVRSKVDGFEGVVEARIDILCGSTQFRVAAPAKDGKEGHRSWCEEGVLEVVHPAVS